MRLPNLKQHQQDFSYKRKSLDIPSSQLSAALARNIHHLDAPPLNFEYECIDEIAPFNLPKVTHGRRNSQFERSRNYDSLPPVSKNPPALHSRAASMPHINPVDEHEDMNLTFTARKKSIDRNQKSLNMMRV